jgi:hypothetical protein
MINFSTATIVQQWNSSPLKVYGPNKDLTDNGQTPFPEPAIETAYPTGLAARHAIVEQLRRPLGSLPEADRAFIDALLGETLDKTIIAGRVRERFQARRGTS